MITEFWQIDGFESEVNIYNPGGGVSMIGLHGFGGSARTFSKLVPHLPEGVTLYSISLPWHGKTKCNDDQARLSLYSYAESLADIISGLPTGKAHLLAHSFGARICSVMAIRHPEACGNLFYIAPGGFYPPEDFMFALTKYWPFSALLKSDFFLKPYVWFLNPGLSKTKQQRFMHALRKVGASYPEISLRREGLLEKLGSYQGHLRLILGRKDKILPASQAGKILLWWERSDAFILENSGHLPFIDEPSEVARLIAAKL